MCGCEMNVVCGYHFELISDFLDRLDKAADLLERRAIAGELDFYGSKVDLVIAKRGMEVAS